MFLTTPASALGDYGQGDQRRYRIGAVAYDRTNNLLQATEFQTEKIFTFLGQDPEI